MVKGGGVSLSEFWWIAAVVDISHGSGGHFVANPTFGNTLNAPLNIHENR